MQLWISYQSCDFYEIFLRFNRRKNVQKAEQLIVTKRSSLFKGMLGVGALQDNYDCDGLDDIHKYECCM